MKTTFKPDKPMVLLVRMVEKHTGKESSHIVNAFESSVYEFCHKLKTKKAEEIHDIIYLSLKEQGLDAKYRCNFDVVETAAFYTDQIKYQNI